MMIPSIVWTICFGIFCLVIAIQVFYYLYFFSRLASYQTVTSKTPAKNPISVIICARDEAHNLVKNLPGILVQDYATPHEVLVVNDNSTDETKYIIDEFKRSFDNLTLVDLTQEAKMISGKKFPLSMGIKSAKHDIVLLTDADCIPASEFWIQKMQEKFKAF
jgi:cellulose synthase/poly-beta-1,6-N-acetylglucosamine synthase-like glycosyltransferase